MSMIRNNDLEKDISEYKLELIRRNTLIEELNRKLQSNDFNHDS